MTATVAIGLTAGTSLEKEFTFYSASEFPDLPEMTWLVDDVLPTFGLASVYGPSGVGKSFLCLDLVAAVAGGSNWFSHTTQSCNVVYIVLEGQAGFRRRVSAWELHHGCSFPERASFIFDQFVVNTLEHPYKLAKQIEERGGAGLIVIDTLNRASPGADENSSINMGEIIAGATMLQMRTGGLVLLVHHPGKDVSRRLRGHSSLIAALDTVIEVDQDGDVVRWKVIKSKDGEGGIAHAFTLGVIELGHSKSGRTLRSCVIQEVEGYTVQATPAGPRGANQQAVLSAVREILVEQRLQSFLETPDWPDGFPAGLPVDEVFARVRGVLNIDPKHRHLRTKEALDRLIEMGYLAHSGTHLVLPSC